jgi:hypothetical protein
MTHAHLPLRQQWFMAKVSAKGAPLTAVPVRLWWDRVFGHHWASKGPGDHPEGYEREGITTGPFARWTSFVGSHVACEEWLARAVQAAKEATEIRRKVGLK